MFRTEEVETTALDRLDLEIGAGEYVAIMVPSGSGKSTLLHLLGLLDGPTDGRVLPARRGGFTPFRATAGTAAQAHHRVVFQNFNLIDELTVFENIELPLIYQQVAAAQRKRRVEEVLERFNLVARRNHLPQQLSGGQQQRVAVARAVVPRPKLIRRTSPPATSTRRTGRRSWSCSRSSTVTGRPSCW